MFGGSERQSPNHQFFTVFQGLRFGENHLPNYRRSIFYSPSVVDLIFDLFYVVDYSN
jgi:hypothetical protein